MCTRVLTLVFFAAYATCIVHEGIYYEGLLPGHHHRTKRRESFRDRCDIQLNNTIPASCNRTIFGVSEEGNFPDEFPEGSSEELAALNSAYAENCIPACINPVVQYFWCVTAGLNYSSNIQKFYSHFVQNWLCGHENGEYCRVKGGRLKDKLAIPEDKIGTCIYETVPKNDLPMTCNSTSPQSCYDGLSAFSSIMGCCTLGYLIELQNCSGVTIDPPCGSDNNAASTSTSTPTRISPNNTSTQQTGSSPAAKALYPFAALLIIAVAILGINY